MFLLTTAQQLKGIFDVTWIVSVTSFFFNVIKGFQITLHRLYINLIQSIIGAYFMNAEYYVQYLNAGYLIRNISIQSSFCYSIPQPDIVAYSRTTTKQSSQR